MSTAEPRPLSRRAWSREPATAWAMLAAVLPLGGWLAWRIHTTIGLGEPRLWQLLRDEPVFDVAMLDFFVTAAWAALVLVERSGPRRWPLLAAMPVFFVVPSLGIAAYILLDRVARRGGAGVEKS